MTHPPHPPSEMVAATLNAMQREYYRKRHHTSDEAWAAAVTVGIRTMFAHVDRAAMARAVYDKLAEYGVGGDDGVLLDGTIRNIGIDRLVQYALAAALAAALPGDA